MNRNSARLADPQSLFDELCRYRFDAFVRKAWPWISGGDLIKWNWHIDAIGYQLDRIAKGQSKRLIVNIPPRNAKSKIVSIIWIAWMLGQDPSLNFVCVSYSNELSGKLARDCLAIMQSHWYRRLFPKTIISSKRSAAYDFETTAGGGRLATSVTGTLTGRGGDIIVLDDVIKPEEANSETTRNAVNDWFQSTLASRLNDKSSGSILCVMQRLHQYDLPGMLLEGGGWDLLSLPAIAFEEQRIPIGRGRIRLRQVGEILHPERESLGILEELKAAMGTYAFQAQYLQDPVPAVGNIFKAEWLQSYDIASASEPGEILQSWDTGIKTGQANDWSVCITARLYRRKLYILDVWRGRLEFPALKQRAVELAQLHRPSALLIEDKASGQQLIQSLRSEDHPSVPMPIARTPDTDKETRAIGVSAMVEAGQLILPKDAPWLAVLVSELLAFPNGRHDDQVDALTQMLDWARARGQHDSSPPVGPAIYYLDEDGDGYWEGDVEGWGEVDDCFDPWTDC